jgi:hypothetical protein
MTPIRVFFLSPTNLHERSLRRMSKDDVCTGEVYRWCSARALIGRIEEESPSSGHVHWPRDDQRWPVACAACGRHFTETDEGLVDYDRLYQRSDNGELVALRNAPPGSCWDAIWYRDRDFDQTPGCASMIGPDGRTLVLRCPDGHDWVIDSRASNCDRKNDNTHWCWVRHGRPEDGTLYVDKAGHTCGAGAGSIQTPSWHGFCDMGFLTERRGR